MDETKTTLIVMTVAVLLPIVPALLLFKALPSQGAIKGPLGPLKGLQIKFGGAFAGYLVIFLVLMQLMPKDSSHYHTWTVMGRIDYRHDPAEPDPSRAEISVRLIPPYLEVPDEGPFTFEIPVTEKADGTLQFPTLHIGVREYQSLTIPLDPAHTYGTQDFGTQYDHKKRIIGFKQPLVLQKSSYAETGAQQPEPIKK
jgi:hypothetical protein